MAPVFPPPISGRVVPTPGGEERISGNLNLPEFRGYVEDSRRRLGLEVWEA